MYMDVSYRAVLHVCAGVDGTVAMVDYNTSDISIRVPAGPATSVTVLIALFDDMIDEAKSEFFVLFLESDNARVDLTGRFAALATIRDDEGECGGKPLPCACVRGLVGQPQSHTVGEGLASPSHIQ